MALLLDINRKLGITILLITHEMHVIRSICDRVAVIDQGQITETGEVLDVFLKPRHPVTRDFLGQLTESLHARTEFPSDRTMALGGRGLKVQITFIGKQTYEPVLFESVKTTNVSFVILQGTISSMKDTPYGQLIVQLSGEPKEIELVLTRLQRQGVDVEVLSS